MKCGRTISEQRALPCCARTYDTKPLSGACQSAELAGHASRAIVLGEGPGTQAGGHMP